MMAAIRGAESAPAYERVLDEYDLTPWLPDSMAFTSHVQAQFQRETQMLDEVGFKPE